jgi:putative flippase GtrA
LNATVRPPPDIRRAGFWFVAVGIAAASLHLGVFAALRHALWPELANAMGFGVAFGLSFVGHRWLSFRGTRTPVRTSLRRFVLTALAGFLLNELVFSALMRLAGWHPLVAQLVAQAAAALLTFGLGRYWAFQH